MDDAVGIVLNKLDELGLSDNTIVCFTSDNGGVSSGDAFSTSNLPLRGGKGTTFEGGVRVPAFAWWPGVVDEGQIVGDIIHETDLFTTFAGLAGAKAHVPTDRIIDGIDQASLFLNGDTHSRRDYVFVYTGNILAASVKGRFKRLLLCVSK